MYVNHITNCSCGADADHRVEFRFYACTRPTLVVSTGLNHYLSFWKRLGVGVKYILGIDNTRCTYVETCLDADEVKRLRKYLVKVDRLTNGELNESND